MKHITIKVFLIGMVIILSINACNFLVQPDSEECENSDYSDCNTEEPFVADMQLLLSTEHKYGLFKLEVYQGYVEDSDILHTDTNMIGVVEKIKIPLITNAEYSAKAYYLKGSDTLVCIDGTNFRKRSYSYCDSTCWYIAGDVLDLRLAD